MALASFWEDVLSVATPFRVGAILALVATLITFYKGYLVRKKFQAIHQQGIPMMKHSMILGHLEIVGKLLADLPSDAHGDYLPLKILQNWRELFPQCTSCPPVAYVDTWPFGEPLAISLSGELSNQFTTEHSLPKAPQQKRVLYPLTKNRDLASMEGEEWKVWRKALSPGFSIQNITTRIPDIIEEVEDMAKVLKTKAGDDGNWGEVFQLERLTTNLALDVVMRFLLNKRFNEQWGKQSDLSAALQDTIARMYFMVNITNVLDYIGPWRQYKLWKNYRTMANQLTPAIRAGVDELNENPQTKSKSLIPLIAQGFKKNQAQGARLQLDATSLELAIGHTTTALFAGFDTTSASLCWLFRLLDEYPAVMRKLREEHDAILGQDAWGVTDVMKANPQLLNQLPYTAAVIKESMRFHTNVGSMRTGEPGYFLTGPPGSGPGFEGKPLPTHGFLVWDGSFAIHRDPDTWHRADEFLPERFLVTDEKDPLYPPPSYCWRSFEAGPRSCIGQHFALIEIKMVMVVVARCFDIEPAWEEWDRIRPGVSKKETVWGDRAYQVGKEGPPRVKDGLPVHVRVRIPQN